MIFGNELANHLSQTSTNHDNFTAYIEDIMQLDKDVQHVVMTAIQVRAGYYLFFFFAETFRSFFAETLLSIETFRSFVPQLY